jgi:hypothetical protein
MIGNRQRFFVHAVAEKNALGILDQATHRDAQLTHFRRDFPVHALFAQPFRASSHRDCPPFYSAMRNKIPLAGQATSGNLPPQLEAVREGKCPPDGPLGERNA